MIKSGDKVKFLNDKGGGTVRGFISKNLVNVENEDGFEIPTLITELVVIEEETPGRVKSQSNKPVKVSVPEIHRVKEEPTRPVFIKGKEEPSFYFALVPEIPANPVGGNINFYLVNNSNFSLIYHYAHLKGATYETVKTGKTGPNSKTRLEAVVQAEFSNLPAFSFTLIPYMEKDNRKIEPVMKTFQVQPVKFYKESSFRSNPFFGTNAMMLEINPNILHAEIDKLTDHDLKEVIRLKEAEVPEPTKRESKAVIPEIVEVDLHIHELIDSTSGLEKSEILEIQMKKFFSEMDDAIKKGVKRVVFIHGIGQGTLKNEIRKELSTRYKKYYFQDASFKEYGYGATMVITGKQDR